MEALGREARKSVRVYLVGGTTAVLMGWRNSTVDVDCRSRKLTAARLAAGTSLFQSCSKTHAALALEAFELAARGEASAGSAAVLHGACRCLTSLTRRRSDTPEG